MALRWTFDFKLKDRIFSTNLQRRIQEKQLQGTVRLPFKSQELNFKKEKVAVNERVKRKMAGIGDEPFRVDFLVLNGGQTSLSIE